MSNITFPCPDYTLSDLQKVDDAKSYCSSCKKHVHVNNPGSDVYCGVENKEATYLSARQFTMRFLVVLILGFGPSLFSNLKAQSLDSTQITVDSVQNQYITGTVTEKDTDEPLPFVAITLEQSGNVIAQATTDFDGLYKLIVPHESHNNDGAQIHFNFIGYDEAIIELESIANESTHVDAQLTADDDLILIGIIISGPPLIDLSPDKQRQTTIKREDIQRMPVGR